MKKKILLIMAQTKPDASFGPIYITHLPWAIKNKNSI